MCHFNNMLYISLLGCEMINYDRMILFRGKKKLAWIRRIGLK